MQPKHVEISTSIICVTALLINGIAMADPVTGLNTFVPGQPATATSVNDNFSEVESSVNDNDGRITTNAGSIGTNLTNIGNNSTAIGTNASDIADNFSSITGNTANITNNFSALDQRLIPLEAGLNGQDIPIDCNADATALLSATLVPGNTYILDGFCDGPIYLSEPAGRYRFRGASGDKALDGIISPVGQTEYYVVGAYGPISARFDDMTVSGDNYTSQTDGVYVGTFYIEGNASVSLNNVDVIGGDAGVFSDAAYVFLGSNVNVTGFGQSGLAAGRTGSILNGGLSTSLTVTGATGLDGGPDGYREALTAFKNGMIDIRGANTTFSGGTDDGSNVNFESFAVNAGDGSAIRIRNNGTVSITGKVGTYRSGSIRIDAGTLTGFVEANYSSVVDLRNMTITGAIEAYATSTITVMDSSHTGGIVWSSQSSFIRFQGASSTNATGFGIGAQFGAGLDFRNTTTVTSDSAIGLSTNSTLNLQDTVDLGSVGIDCQTQANQVAIGAGVTSVGSLAGCQ